MPVEPWDTPTPGGANDIIIRKKMIIKKKKKPVFMSFKLGLKFLILSGRKLRAVKKDIYHHQPPEVEEEDDEEEEEDDFDKRCAALPPSVLIAVKRVHLAMAMEKFKKELECRDTQGPKNDSHI